MIAQKTTAGRFDIAPIAVYTIGVSILGAGLWLGALQNGQIAHAQSIADNKAAIQSFTTVDKRLVAVETDMAEIKRAQIATSQSLMAAREAQNGIQANQENLSKQVGQIARGVEDIKALLMNPGR